MSLNLGRLQYRPLIDDSAARMERVTGLNPNTSYRVYLRATTAIGDGEPIFVDATTELSGRMCLCACSIHCLINVMSCDILTHRL